MSISSQATDISRLSAVDLQHHFYQRTLSPVEVIQTAIDRIAENEPLVNAFVLVDAEKALAEAKASEVRWQKGEPLSAIDASVN